MSVLVLLDRGLAGEHRGARTDVGLLPHSRTEIGAFHASSRTESRPPPVVRIAASDRSARDALPRAVSEFRVFGWNQCCSVRQDRVVYLSQPRHGRSIMSRSFAAIGSLAVLLAVATSAAGAGGPLVDPIPRTLRQARVTIALQPVA